MRLLPELKSLCFVFSACAVSFATVCHGQNFAVRQERLAPHAEKIPEAVAAHFKNYDVIVSPDKDAPEWWAGAPSVVRDKEGVFWMACRMRTADAPRGLRGYEIRILRSDDGIKFTKVHSILREAVPIPGFERPALLLDPVHREVQIVRLWTMAKRSLVDH